MKIDNKKSKQKESKAEKKVSLWEIDPRYTVRVVKGDNWNKVSCLRCELEKYVEKEDFEMKELMYVKGKMWICANKPGSLGTLLSQKAIEGFGNKFSLVKLNRDFQKIIEELQEKGLWCIHTEEAEEW